ncbi:MAG: cysteine synthase A [Clostridia bacterium]|nr:cysteine synthase A [Clostridia bacterium]
MVYKSITELVGGTPLIELVNYEKKLGLDAKVLAKLEYFNPTGSVKDRAAKFMIEDAERSGRLKKGMTVIEPTSGNTGIGIAAIAAAKGYRAVVTMPKSMSAERRALLAAFGAEIVLTDDMSGAVRKAAELASELGGLVLGQFTNPANAEAHRKTTGAEIWKDTEGKVDIFVAGIGSGGTVTGAGEYLKGKNPNIRVVAVEPAEGQSIQGLGAGFVPEILNTEIYGESISVGTEEALTAAKLVCKTDGLFVGISSGAALRAAEKLARRAENAKKNIVVIFPDSGDRYLSIFQTQKIVG